MHLKNLKKHFKKLQYGSDYLFNEHNEEDYITSNNDINAFKEIRKFLMSEEVIFYVKKQMKLEKNEIKRKLSIIF